MGEEVKGVGSSETNYYHVINSLHRLDQPPEKRWNPHPSQLLVGQAVFRSGAKNIFIQCGRKWGKTEIIIYCLWRWALLNPNSSCYYICPTLKQAEEVVWMSKDRNGRSRIQEFGSSEFISSIDKSDLRVNFKNGSFIKVDGSDNYAPWAGISPNFLVLDEFSDFKPEFYGVMNPNRATFDAPCMIIGTPPEQIWIDKDTPHQYVEIAQEYRADMLDGGQSFWIKRPSWDNPDPTIQNFLLREKKALFRRKREYEWFRYYGAELVPGSARKIFPDFKGDPTVPDSHVLSHSDMISALMGQLTLH